MSVLKVSSKAAPWCGALLVGLTLMACGPTLPPEPPPPQPELPAGSSLYLEVRSLEGAPVPEAQVRASSSPPQKVSPVGTVLLEEVPAGPQLLHVQAEGFFSTVLSVELATEVHAGARLKLVPLGAPHPVDPSQRQSIPLPAGGSLRIPPHSLFDAEGNPIQGPVEAFVKELNLEKDELLAVPGVLEALVPPETEPVGLEPVGVVAISFRHNGHAAFARSVGVGGRVPGPVRVGSQSLPPSRPGPARPLALEDCQGTVPVFQYQASSGTWLPTGQSATLTKSVNAQGDTVCNYLAERVDVEPGATMLSVARVYKAEETACLTVRVVDTAGQPVAGQQVVARGVGSPRLSSAVTDGDGQALLKLRANQPIELSAGMVSQQLSTGSAGTCGGQGLRPPDVHVISVAPRTCTPGAALACPYGGPAGTQGQGICQAARQSCDVEGAGWSPCQGEVLPQEERCDTSRDENCDGALNEGCPTLCTEGATDSCYEHEAAPLTRGVGLCREGTRTCLAGGRAWSACSGQVLPREENYSQPGDENCDGVARQCWPGKQVLCDSYSGPPATRGVGACHADIRTCEPSGAGWGACTGEVTPQAESCATPQDENCDGWRDEASSCGWVARPSMSVARAEHIAVVLNDGTVLVAGGVIPGTSPQSLASSEVYDPDTHTWTPVGNMTSPRRRFRAVLLANGQVLAMGGYGNNPGALDTAEVYDPVSKTWTPVGDMKSARVRHTATRLNNGQVLVVGGYGPSDNLLDTAEVYDPVSKTWDAVGNTTSLRGFHDAVLLADGQVLVMGGRLADATRSNTSERYDPNSKQWTAIQSLMNHGRLGHTATLLSNGQVLVAGGHGNGTHILLAELYEPNSKQWSLTGALTTVRDEHQAVRLGTGQVLVAGGDSGANSTTSVELYEPSLNTWTTVHSMSTSRARHTLVWLGRKNEVLVMGGQATETATAATSDTTELYNWVPPNPVP